MAKNVVIFNGTNASGRDGIWITDGTAAGTQELTGITGAYSGGGGLQFDPLDFTVFTERFCSWVSIRPRPVVCG